MFGSLLMACSSPNPYHAGSVYPMYTDSTASQGSPDGVDTAMSYSGSYAIYNGTTSKVDHGQAQADFAAISTWAFIGQSGGVQVGHGAFGNGTSTSRLYILCYTSAEDCPMVYIQWRNGSTSGTYNYAAYQLTTTTLSSTGEWVHFYIERQPDTLYDRVYINGEPYNFISNNISSGTTTKTFTGSAKSGYVTSNNEPATYYPCNMRDIRFLENTLTAEEIAEIHSSGK